MFNIGRMAGAGYGEPPKLAPAVATTLEKDRIEQC